MSNTTPQGVDFFICIIVFTVICSVFLGLRIWAAQIVRRPLYLDDGLVAFAFVSCAPSDYLPQHSNVVTSRDMRLWLPLITFLSITLHAQGAIFRPLTHHLSLPQATTLALSGTIFWLVFNGMGKHINEVTASELGITFQVVTAAYVCWTLGTGSIKLSVLVLYTRIFRTAAFRRWSSVLMAAVGAFTVAFFVVFLTNCVPVSQEWNPVPGGHCRDQAPSEFSSVSCSLLIDLAIIILPFPWLWKLQMPMRNKVTVSITLSIGFT